MQQSACWQILFSTGVFILRFHTPSATSCRSSTQDVVRLNARFQVFGEDANFGASDWCWWLTSPTEYFPRKSEFVFQLAGIKISNAKR